MEVKLFEVRDSLTFIPVLAIHVMGQTPRERWLLHRVGYGGGVSAPARTIFLTSLVGNVETLSEAHRWPNKTLREAHLYIREYWRQLPSGAVIDCEYIRGESVSPKESEFFDDYPKKASDGHANTK